MRSICSKLGQTLKETRICFFFLEFLFLFFHLLSKQWKLIDIMRRICYFTSGFHALRAILNSASRLSLDPPFFNLCYRTFVLLNSKTQFRRIFNSLKPSRFKHFYFSWRLPRSPPLWEWKKRKDSKDEFGNQGKVFFILLSLLSLWKEMKEGPGQLITFR